MKQKLYPHNIKQSIATKDLPATNHKGFRIKATAQAGSIILNRDDNLSHVDNHFSAASALAFKFLWLEHDRLVGGSINGSDYVWILVEDEE
jgi:hypothetical protein